MASVVWITPYHCTPDYLSDRHFRGLALFSQSDFKELLGTPLNHVIASRLSAWQSLRSLAMATRCSMNIYN
ncbi:MAG: hypothetical protein PH343_08300 [Nitrospira sp.]|nr:hypothetical protein [Nitrospira sp.]